MPWNPRTIDGQVLAVHAALLHTGHILYFGGDEHDPNNSEAGDIDHTCLFNCETGAVTRIGSPTTDVFCAGHAFLADGSLLVAGGTESYDLTGIQDEFHHEHFRGLRDTWIFDPWSQSWRRAASMNTRKLTNDPKTPKDPAKTGGRWYPTLITLSNGEVLAMAGHPGRSDAEHDNDTPEIFSSGSGGGAWRLLPQVDPTPLYPRMHVIAGGDVLCVTPLGSRMRSYDWRSGAWVGDYNAPNLRDNSFPTPPGANAIYNGYAGTSVLLPMHYEQGYQQRVLLCGSSQPLMLDLGQDNPKWEATAKRTLAGAPQRFHLNAVLLPTGEVFVCGGIRPDIKPNTQNAHWDFLTPDKPNAVLAAESYDPVCNSWSTLPEAKVPRNYHSVALLMPDGRVWTAGSSINAGRGPASRELRIEIFEPWFVSRPDRPIINGIGEPQFVEQPFIVMTPAPTSIGKVVLIRAGSCTHAFNSDQRYLSVPFEVEGADRLQVTVPTNDGSLMPPGYYLLYLVNKEGVPSKGRFVRIQRREPMQSLEPPLTYLDILGGIISDGGGIYVLPSGKVKKVPPHSPLRDMLAAIVIRETARSMQHPAGIRLQVAALNTLTAIAESEIQRLGGM
jgi:hypothetical protein